MTEYYVTVCSRHKVHTEDCFACRNFDRAVMDYIGSYVVPRPNIRQ